MPHGAERLIRIGLDAQLEGLFHRFKGNRALSVADSGLRAVHAVAALLGPDVGLRHVRDPAGDLTNGKLLPHIAIALTSAPGVGHVVKALVQPEALSEARDDAAAGGAVQPACDQNAVLHALIGVRDGEHRLFVGDPPHDHHAVIQPFRGDDLLCLGQVGLHGVCEEHICVVVRGGAVEKRFLLRARKRLAVCQPPGEYPVFHGNAPRQRLCAPGGGNVPLQNELLLRNRLPGFCVRHRDDGREVAVLLLPHVQLHLHLPQRRDADLQLLRRAVVPRDGQRVTLAAGKRRGVEDFKDVAGNVAYADGAVDEFYDPCAHRGPPVGIEHPVHAEVPVVLPLPVVAAVGEAAVLVQHGMVRHLPDAAAHEVVVPVDLLPVGLRVSGADAHGVGILAHEIGPVVEGLLLSLMLAHVVQHFDAGVHLAAHVIGDLFAVNGALVVDRKR